MLTIQNIYDILDTLAPFETQEPYDNAGLLVGDAGWAVRGIHVALDVTDRVLDEAEAAGANLLLTHHPMMFSARKRMTEMDTEGRLLCRMIRGRMGLIAAHTNWDRAPGGINDTLAAALGLTGVTGEGFLRAGDLPEALTAGELSALVSERLKTPVRPMAQWPAERRARRVAVCGGAGSELWEEALALGAEVFVVGEMKHHHALLAADAGMLALEAGHFATEEPGIFALADALQKALNAVQCSIPFTRSEAGGYACPGAR